MLAYLVPFVKRQEVRLTKFLFHCPRDRPQVCGTRASTARAPSMPWVWKGGFNPDFVRQSLTYLANLRLRTTVIGITPACTHDVHSPSGASDGLGRR